MRPTGTLHLGHYLGVLKNWVQLQHEYECFFFAADWHALTSDYRDPSKLLENTREMVMTWLAVGIDPEQAVLARGPEEGVLVVERGLHPEGSVGHFLLMRSARVIAS